MEVRKGVIARGVDCRPGEPPLLQNMTLRITSISNRFRREGMAVIFLRPGLLGVKLSCGLSWQAVVGAPRASNSHTELRT